MAIAETSTAQALISTGFKASLLFSMIKLKRIYEEPDVADGERYLVERLWPRGMKREKACLDAWLKDLAPSPDLRKWFDHDPAKWPEFQKRYQAELKRKKIRESLQDLARKANRAMVTFVFAAKDQERNSAVVLKKTIEGII